MSRPRRARPARPIRRLCFGGFDRNPRVARAGVRSPRRGAYRRGGLARDGCRLCHQPAGRLGLDRRGPGRRRAANDDGRGATEFGSRRSWLGRGLARSKGRRRRTEKEKREHGGCLISMLHALISLHSETPSRRRGAQDPRRFGWRRGVRRSSCSKSRRAPRVGWGRDHTCPRSTPKHCRPYRRHHMDWRPAGNCPLLVGRPGFLPAQGPSFS